MATVLPHRARRWISTVRWRRVVAYVVVALALFTAVGFFVVPPLLKAKLESSLTAGLQRDVAVGGLSFNPFTLVATLSNVAVTPHGGGAPLLAIDRFQVSVEAVSLFRLAPIIGALRIEHPQVRLVRQPDGRYNVSDLIDAALAAPPGPPPRFSISNIEVVDGRIDFDDQPDRRQHTVTDIHLGVPFVSSLPSNVEITVQPAFSARINGRPVAISGETRPFADSRATTLHLDVSGLEIASYMQYVPMPLRFDVHSGAVDARLVVLFATHAGKAPTLELSGSASVHDLSITDKRAMTLLAVPSLVVALDKFDLSNQVLDVRTIAVDGADVNLVHAVDGSLNLALLAPAAGAPAGGGPSAPAGSSSRDAAPTSFRFNIGEVKVSRSTLHVVDDAVQPALHAVLSDVALTANNVSNARGAKATIDAAFATDAGAQVTHHGSFALDPLLFDGRLHIVGLELKRLFPYYQSALNLQVDAGTLDATTDISVAVSGSDTQLALSNLDAALNGLILRLPQANEALWRIPSVAAHGASVDIGKHTVMLGNVDAKGAVIAVRHNADGSFNFDRLLKTSDTGGAARSATNDWRVEAPKVSVDDFAFTFDDMTVSPAAHFAMSRIAMSADNVSNVAGARSRVRATATVNEHGLVTIAGPLTTAPLTGALTVTARSIDLVPFQPYVAQGARVIVTGGTISTQGIVDFAVGEHARAGFKGEVTMADVATLDEANTTDLLKWRSLRLGGIAAQSDPLAVSIDDIQLDEFYARLLLNENGELNLQQLARNQAPPAPGATQESARLAASNAGPTTASLPPRESKAVSWLKLGKATLSGGNVYFTDHFIRPNYSANLTALTGTLSTLTFDTPADIGLRGSVDNVAPVEIAGRLNPLAQDLFVDLKASAKDIELSPTSPYSDKYAGYGIQKGKMSVDVHYVIDHRTLTADNRFVLDQLTFGDKVESPDATKLPVLLAVALLKDRNGVIDIKLPISGSLDDPHFSVGGIVIQALVNLLVKIVTSPFALLGSLGGGSEQLAYVEFVPGNGNIDAAAENKLKTLGKALLDRPALKLDIAGRADPATDRDGLKRAMLDRKVRQQRFNDIVKQGDPPASVDDVKIPPADYPALLTRVYRAEDIEKPRNAIGLLKDVPPEEMERLLLASFGADDEALRQLASDRAQRATRYLVEVEHVPAERIFLVAPNLGAPTSKDAGKPSRVDFALR